MKKRRIKLSAKEKKRKEIFDSKYEEMHKAGYETKYLTVSLLMANILSFIVMFPFIIFFMYLYIRWWWRFFNYHKITPI